MKKHVMLHIRFLPQASVHRVSRSYRWAFPYVTASLSIHSSSIVCQSTHPQATSGNIILFALTLELLLGSLAFPFHMHHVGGQSE